MPELRQNLATREWVIIATDRAKRPQTYAKVQPQTLTHQQNIYDQTCPFCLGNEELDLETARWPANGNWQVRSVHNKYPALHKDENLISSSNQIERFISGVGHHEVVVEHPHHNTTLALLKASEIEAVLDLFYTRGWAIQDDSRIKQLIYFKNHGQQAGASLQHSHSQIIGLPVVPTTIHRRLQEAQHYFADTGDCVYCTIAQAEMQNPARIVTFNDHFMASILYAAPTPFNIWIMPHNHRVSFLYTDKAERADLAKILRDVLHRIYVALNDPDFNLVIRSAPISELNNPYFHWHLEVVPRLNQEAGFELGSGMHINPTLPEACAAFLRDLKIESVGL